ncbi:MAG: acyltransferase [Aliarcobacter sp.]|nr:acyltransferase [Aliarcobacter sp.]
MNIDLNKENLTKRIALLDCIRALAILFVVLVHYRSDVAPGGAIGVSVFFALSGYLITSMLLNEKQLDRGTVARFIVRRFLRVYVPYAATLGIIYVVIVLIESPILATYLVALPNLLTFTYNNLWHSMPVGVMWTLQVEFWFYITLPLLMYVFGRGRLFLAIILLLTAVSLAHHFGQQLLTAISYVRVVDNLRLYWIDGLLFGALAAMYLHQYGTVDLLKKYYLAISTACLMSLWAIALFVSSDLGVYWTIASLAASAISAIWIIAYMSAGVEVYSPITEWFGRISYSLYLVHAIPLLFHGKLPWPVSIESSRMWGVFVIAIIAATILHYTVEKPTIRLARFMTSKKKPLPLENIVDFPSFPTSTLGMHIKTK